tara:strand:- start:1994 stop:3115 length:1122 start_codon:yes stop_codon:yes gene_type:complete
MSDLLKEAIADAKAVRETALANAKMALEEAFTPHLKSMLSAKLAEEDLEEDEDVFEGEHEDEEETDEGMGMKPRRDDDDDEDPDEGMHDDPRREDDDDEGKDEGMHDKPRREDDDDEKEVDESEIVEIDGVKYAPIVSEEDEDDPRREDDDDEMKEDIELDLEAVIKELEEELNESEPGEEEESVQEGAHEDDEDEKKDESVNEEEELDEEEDLEEQSKSSGIGAGDNKVVQPSASDEEDPGKGKIKESVEKLQGELNEYKEAVLYLKDKLHEVNILNAKLLYTNKLFKEFVLSNDQKLKIVETFDRAQTTREIKLVYSTLAESYKDNGGERKEVVKESYASKKSGGTAPKAKIITEESQVADRFRKLAGLKS